MSYKRLGVLTLIIVGIAIIAIVIGALGPFTFNVRLTIIYLGIILFSIGVITGVIWYILNILKS